MYDITRGAIVRVGADLAKRVIQVHAVDAAGRRVVGRALKREQFMAWCAQLPAGCLVAMEACSSAHHWARKLRALGLDARLIAAHFVSPYRMEGKSGKNDMTDVAAICKAASRPSMRFVPVKTCEQQGVMSLHRVREAASTRSAACWPNSGSSSRKAPRSCAPCWNYEGCLDWRIDRETTALLCLIRKIQGVRPRGHTLRHACEVTCLPR